MALEGSHMRVALAVQEELQIADSGAYLRGTIYPDSRYITGVDRILTHPTGYKDDPAFMGDDFYKGWFVHLLCDDIQYQATQEALPAVCEGQDSQGSDVWVRRTAIKIIQDMNDVRQFDIVPLLPYLHKPLAPHEENMELLERYYAICVEMYKNPDKLSLEGSYAPFWSAFGIDDNTRARLMQQTSIYLKDAEVKSKAEGLYDIITKRLKARLRLLAEGAID